MKSQSTERPSVLLNLGNGKWHYNYNIQEVVIEDKTMYQCDTIEIAGDPTADNIKETMIELNYNYNFEKKLINDYNAAQAGLFDAEKKVKCIDEYTKFLLWRRDMKVMVNRDLGKDEEVQ